MPYQCIKIDEKSIITFNPLEDKIIIIITDDNEKRNTESSENLVGYNIIVFRTFFIQQTCLNYYSRSYTFLKKISCLQTPINIS